MSFSALIHKLFNGHNESFGPYQANTAKLPARLWDVFLATYDLGFIAFGGPPVHFQILHRRFVDKESKTPWIDEQTVLRILHIAVMWLIPSVQGIICDMPGLPRSRLY